MVKQSIYLQWNESKSMTIQTRTISFQKQFKVAITMMTIKWRRLDASPRETCGQIKLAPDALARRCLVPTISRRIPLQPFTILRILLQRLINLNEPSLPLSNQHYLTTVTLTTSALWAIPQLQRLHDSPAYLKGTTFHTTRCGKLLFTAAVLLTSAPLTPMMWELKISPESALFYRAIIPATHRISH